MPEQITVTIGCGGRCSKKCDLQIRYQLLLWRIWFPYEIHVNMQALGL